MRTSEFISEHLANQRTYLAFLRTSISIIGFGITINRFAAFLIESKSVSARAQGAVGLVGAEHLGSIMVVAGVLFLLFATVYYQHTSAQIEARSFAPRPSTAWIITSIITIGSIIVLIWLVST